MEDGTITPECRTKPSERDAAPSPWSLAIALALSMVLLAILGPILSSLFGRGFHLTRLWLSPMGVLMAAPAVMAALLTRRSPLPVTISAAAIAMLTMPRMPFPHTLGYMPALFAGLAVWLAATRSPIPSPGLRRAPGERMPSRFWIPAVALLMVPLPIIVRALVANRDAPVGIATAMIVLPVAYAIFGAWLAAFVCDRFGAAVAKDALARS